MPDAVRSTRRLLAHWGGALVARGIELVYGGGRVGLMGVLAEGSDPGVHLDAMSGSAASLTSVPRRIEPSDR